jgi:hypothetical protein
LTDRTGVFPPECAVQQNVYRATPYSLVISAAFPTKSEGSKNLFFSGRVDGGSGRADFKDTLSLSYIDKIG